MKIKSILEKWLISFLIFHVALYLIDGLDLLFGELIDGFPRLDGFISKRLVGSLLTFPFLHLIIGATTYYCSYLKRGTTWLSILIISLFLYASINLKQFISYGNYGWFLVGCPVGMMLKMILSFYLLSYYLFNCYQLYKINGGKWLFEGLYQFYKVNHKKHFDELLLLLKNPNK